MFVFYKRFWKASAIYMTIFHLTLKSIIFRHYTYLQSSQQRETVYLQWKAQVNIFAKVSLFH